MFLSKNYPPSPPLAWNLPWLTFDSFQLSLGVLLDPTSAAMSLMVAAVSLLVFIYSAGYIAADPNAGKFFTYLSLFTAAMQGVVVSNSLLLTFICWELVGLCSYLLIGFWHFKPEAAAAAKKAFLVTRFGDIGLFLGVLWMQAATGTLLLYDSGKGCLELELLTGLASTLAFGGIAISNCIAILIFLGAIGKSGQFPLHVWLPDAMEGPTPVSALIHAATMVAAGVYLVVRLFPLFAATALEPSQTTSSLAIVAWTGAITSLFAALLAVAQYDIKRILAYSTVSQLGFMMVAVGVGSPLAGLIHLLAHGVFKALLFLGAGSVIHGCHGEQDIRHMGGLRKAMPATFAVYLLGVLSLAGFPLLFCGFWTKEAIFHAAHAWHSSHVPFYLVLTAAFLTAFYMIRQTVAVFARTHRSHHVPHESPLLMVLPMTLLALASMLLSFLLTPAWPWLEAFLKGDVGHLQPDFTVFLKTEFVSLALLSSLLTLSAMTIAYFLYRKAEGREPLAKALGGVYRAFEQRLWLDELYRALLVASARAVGCCFAALDQFVFRGAVSFVAALFSVFAKIVDFFDQFFVNLWFDVICGGMKDGGGTVARIGCGRVGSQLRFLGAGLVVLLVSLLLYLVLQG